MRTLSSFALSLIVAACASASESLSRSELKMDATVKAYAAGYKAGYVCSAIFNAGKTLAQIESHELTGIYPVVAELLPVMPMSVNREARRVSVSWDETMPPRISQWRPHLGCVDLPVGAGEDALKKIPGIDITGADFHADADDGKPWGIRADINGSSGNAALDTVISQAFSGKYGGDDRTTAVLVATSDAILAEHYVDGFTPETSQRTWSVAKSIAASIVGAAVHRGMIDVTDPAALPEWSEPGDPRAEITLEQLLYMASGLDSNVAGNRTDRVYIGGGLVRDNAAAAYLEAIPGSRWKYANNDTMFVARALRHAAFESQDAFMRFPFEALLYKIGMYHTQLETDWAGDFVLSSQVWTTSRDLARLGLLYLADGVWDGERILAEGWANYVATAAPSQPPRQAGDNSPSRGYGAQWWLFDEFPGLPADSYAAIGNRGQFLMIVPSAGIVIIRRGYDMAGGDSFRIHDFAAAVLATVK